MGLFNFQMDLKALEQQVSGGLLFFFCYLQVQKELGKSYQGKNSFSSL